MPNCKCSILNAQWPPAHWLSSILHFALSLVLLLCVSASAQIRLDWDPSPSSNVVASYRIHHGQARRTNSDPALYRYPFTNTFPRDVMTALITNLAPGLWYFSATALASNGITSAYTTNELAITNQLPPPARLRMTGPADALILQSAPSPDGPWKTLAVITSTNQPIQLVATPRQLFRVLSTNLPPLP